MTPQRRPPPHPTPPPVPPALLGGLVGEWLRLAARRSDVVSASGTDADDGSDSEETADVEPASPPLWVDAFGRTGARAVPPGPGGTLPRDTRTEEALRALRAAAAREGSDGEPMPFRAVVVDEDPAHAEALAEELAEAGWMPRPRLADEAASLALEPDEVALVESAFAPAAEPLLDAAGGSASLWLLHPPAARRLPWALLARLAALPRADLLLVFPAADFRRLARFGTAPVADLPPHVRRVVEGCSALLGDERHEWLAVWRAAEAEGGPDAAEAAVAARLEARLREAAGTKTVRALRPTSTDAADDEAGGLLFLVAEEVRLALALNGVLREAGLEDRHPASAGAQAPLVVEPEEEDAALELFAPGQLPAGAAPSPVEAPRKVDTAAVAELVAARFRGRTVEYGEVLASLAGSDLDVEEARRAMSSLKRSGRAVYRSLADDHAKVEFPEEPVPPPAPRRRRKTPEGPGLFGED